MHCEPKNLRPLRLALILKRGQRMTGTVVDYAYNDLDGVGELRLQPKASMYPVGKFPTGGKKKVETLTFRVWTKRLVLRLVGKAIWLGPSYVMLGNVQVAERRGRRGIVFANDATLETAIAMYEQKEKCGDGT